MKKLYILHVILLIPLIALSQNLITNGSFELGSFTDTGGGYHQLPEGSNVINGWTVINNEIVWGGPSNVDSIMAPDGQFFLDLTSYGRVNPIGGVSQTISTVPGVDYHLNVEIFNPVDASPVSINVEAGAISVLMNTSGGFDFTATQTNTLINIVGIDGGPFVGLDNVSVEAIPDIDQVVPTMTEWGIIFLIVSILFVAMHQLRLVAIGTK